MGVSIMILDDSAVMRKIVMRTVRQSGLTISQVLEGSCGEDGLKLLMEGNRPDLILSDINMAGMDGISFVKKARELVSSATTKIVMITTEGGSDRRGEALSAGANIYITKPFTAEQIANSLSGLQLRG